MEDPPAYARHEAMDARVRGPTGVGAPAGAGASGVAIVLGAYPRIHLACRARGGAGGVGTGDGRRLSEHQVKILGHLDAVDPAMVSELAEQMGVTPSTMSLNLGRLEGRGLVERRRDPADRRVVNVRLTPLGASVKEERTMLDPDRVYAMLHRLRPEDRRRAVEGIALLAGAADALLAGSSLP